MGSYLNPGSGRFRGSLRSQIYVDKSGLLEQTNAKIGTEQKYLCISRPRRFGKSMAMDMLAAYYDRAEDTSGLFEGLEVSRIPSFREHLNRYDVVKVNMQDFLSVTGSVGEMLDMLQRRILSELKEKYPEWADEPQLVFAMQDIYAGTGCPFIILIDEWDCLFREYGQDPEVQKKYLDFLRTWLKDKDYVALAYMTGILPVKKYGTHSALNMFIEYSMTEPGDFARFFGFTEDEVEELCGEYRMSFEEARAWYNGYRLVEHSRFGDRAYSMYSPKSVVEAMLRHKFGPYWNRTETYEALKIYIQMNMDGLKDAVVKMLAGDSVRINTGTFTNDMTTFATKDDVLTLLVHLGYLTYNGDAETASIPNREVSQEYVNAISTMDWQEVIRSVNESRRLLEALWAGDGDAVAEGIDRAHNEISILRYNDENSLSCTVGLAFYFAREYYTVVREMPAGRGFADICMIPRRLHADKPAAILELKWDGSAQGAIAQIRNRQYVEALKDYQGSLLLAGISYDRKSKKHSCVIERMELYKAAAYE